MHRRHYNKLLTAVVLGCFGVASACQATLVTISDMNADSPTSQLEGTLGGSGVSGGSAFEITAAPSTSVLASTSAVYAVSGVDLDGDSVFDESFVFSITFSSPSGVNFTSTRETIGIGANEIFDIGESITLTFAIQSDTSATHDVVFDGVSEVDFQNHTGTEMNVTSPSGDTSVTVAGGNTSLGGLFVNPTLSLVSAPLNDPSNGNLEDWSVQFSSVSAIPEPTAFLFGGLAACGIGATRLRRRRPANLS